MRKLSCVGIEIQVCSNVRTLVLCLIWVFSCTQLVLGTWVSEEICLLYSSRLAILSSSPRLLVLVGERKKRAPGSGPGNRIFPSAASDSRALKDTWMTPLEMCCKTGHAPLSTEVTRAPSGQPDSTPFLGVTSCLESFLLESSLRQIVSKALESPLASTWPTERAQDPSPSQTPQA